MIREEEQRHADLMRRFPQWHAWRLSSTMLNLASLTLQGLMFAQIYATFPRRYVSITIDRYSEGSEPAEQDESWTIAVYVGGYDQQISFEAPTYGQALLRALLGALDFAKDMES